MTVIDMPMLALQPCALTTEDIAVMEQWLAGDYQALVIVSPTAANCGLAAWKKLETTDLKNVDSELSDLETELSEIAVLDRVNKAPSQIIAVGEATATVLKSNERRIENYQVLQPLIADNEGMLAMPEIEGLQKGDKLLVWRGLGGRRLLVDTLSARGVHIDSIAWYERVMPKDARDNYQRWCEQMIAFPTTGLLKPIVIISSGTTFEHWTDIVTQRQQTKFDNKYKLDNQPKPNDKLEELSAKVQSNQKPWPTLNDFIYIVLGERLARIVAKEQLICWRVEDLAPETILSTIKHKIDGIQ